MSEALIKSNTHSGNIRKVKLGYQKTSVGIIPEDWEVKKLSEIGKFHRGKGLSKAQLVKKGLNAIRYGEIYTVHHYFIKHFYSFIDESIAKESFPLVSGDLLFTGSGETLEEIGKSVAFIGEEKAYAGGDLIILRPKKVDYYSKFLGFITNTDVFKRQTYRVGQGNAVVHIYPSNLKKIKLPIPPLPKQKSIADCLSTWDAGIEKLTQLIQAKKQQKKGLMQQLLTGTLRLRSASGEKFDGEWKELRLGDYFKESKIKSENNDKNKRISVRLHLEGIIKREVRGTEADSTQFYKRKAGQFIYGKQNFHNGSLGIIPEKYHNYETTSDIPSFDINEHINHNFIFLFICRKDFYEKMESKTTGTGSKRLHPSEFLNTKVKIPPLKEQTAIAKVLQTADQEIELLEQKLAAFQQQKKGLMQVLLTGEKRLIENE